VELLRMSRCCLQRRYDSGDALTEEEIQRRPNVIHNANKAKARNSNKSSEKSIQQQQQFNQED
ncbi:MAG: hypothetical protein ACK55I_38985, partial [bacterium]